MKKILVIHNKYKFLGGEDIAVNAEVSILKKYYDVELLIFDNASINFISDVYSFVFNRNPRSIRMLKKEIKRFDPHLIYVHNTWYKASVAMFSYLKKINKPTVIKLHNFRYSCTRHFLNKNHLDKDNICFKCGLRKKGLFNKYFVDSYVKSFLMIRYGKKYYKMLQSPKFKITVLTKFHKQYLEKLGFKGGKIYTLYNPIEILHHDNYNPSNYMVYAGRVSKEKGIEELITSFIKADVNKLILKIIGVGPDLEYLKLKYLENINIEFLGQLTNEQTKLLISESKVVVTATKLYEGQPTLLCEATSLGVPSIFPKFGGIQEFFPSDVKLSFQQFDYDDLINKIKMVDTKDFSSEGEKNQVYLAKYFSESNYIERFNVIINE
jgi:glycosyltransferase involved in cell wall biosynthesis